MNDFFVSLARRWSESADKRGTSIPAPELDPAIADEILQLARVVAHSRERSYAPLASYMAGVAVERLRTAGTADPAACAAVIREVREALEREAAGRDRAG